MSPSGQILTRLRVVYFCAVLLGLAVLGKAVSIGVVNRQVWLEEREKSVKPKLETIKAVRGNILAADGTPLSVSIPQYIVRLDFSVEKLRKNYPSKVDSFVSGMKVLFPDIDVAELKTKLKRGYKNPSYHPTIRKNLSYTELQQMLKLPMLNDKRRAGIIVDPINRRTAPLGNLAYMVIGGLNSLNQRFGLEASFNEELEGRDGLMLMQQLSPSLRVPVEGAEGVEPIPGSDIITTLDVQLQDVAENALRRQLQYNNADEGCVIVMEVKTGYIKAVANLSRSVKDSSAYEEIYNRAFTALWAPGSTFKLASLLALVEDGLADTSDIVDTQGGVIRFGSHAIHDSKPGGYGKIPLSQAFIVSSNVGIIKAMLKGYQKDPTKFIAHLQKFRFGRPSGVNLFGELAGTYYHPNHDSWSRSSLPSLSIGYESSIPPIQLLAFYNAIANQGKYLRPQLVSEIRNNGKLIRSFPPSVADTAICSKQTLQKVLPLLRGVVQRGTATNLKNPYYDIAGKTGTAKGKKPHPISKEAVPSYRASFAGFFPYDNPRYSCIVVIDNPNREGIYGNVVAGPVFKEIADKIFARDKEMQKHFVRALASNAKDIKETGYGEDYAAIAEVLDLEVEKTNADWYQSGQTMKIAEGRDGDVVMPNVTGLGLRDALYLLENLGLRVKASGKGKVVRQSVAPGTAISKYASITLQLA